MAEIKGKLFKSNYKMLTPDGAEMGSVSKKWAGMAKEMFTSADTYAVQIAPAFADKPNAKMLHLGAAVAIDAFLGGEGGKGGGGGDEGGGDE